VHGHARDRRIVDAEIVSAPTKTFAPPMPTERSPLLAHAPAGEES